ncbi:hypothetical protein OUZ56_005473 [Daphnia magna]|uniref:Uncharacterized protein n=1 Tax=Daphnia magna TaxID=35525 RepID=A0ABQ9YSW9_9CRUS|nr:hypothetical protein OUZ56_005473 [Daphnia magna]
MIPRPISDELTIFLLKPLSGEESKAISKRFPMVFEDPDFGLKPSKLDGYMQRQAKDMGVLKAVNTTEDVLITAQLKIMDVAPPLVDLYARFSAPGGGEAEELIKVSVEAALRQWGRAFLHVTKLRGQAVISRVEHKSEFILSDPEVFAPGKEARELLFTDRFLSAMLKEAKQDATLAQRDGLVTAAKQSSIQRPRQHTRRVAVKRPTFVPFRTHRPALGAARGRGLGRLAQCGRGHGRAQNTFTQRQRLQHYGVGGRLQFFAKNWKRVTDDPWVLGTVSEGLKIDFISNPT